MASACDSGMYLCIDDDKGDENGRLLRHCELVMNVCQLTQSGGKSTSRLLLKMGNGRKGQVGIAPKKTMKKEVAKGSFF